jgi:hypothetical protein
MNYDEAAGDMHMCMRGGREGEGGEREREREKRESKRERERPAMASFGTVGISCLPWK